MRSRIRPLGNTIVPQAYEATKFILLSQSIISAFKNLNASRSLEPQCENCNWRSFIGSEYIVESRTALVVYSFRRAVLSAVGIYFVCFVRANFLIKQREISRSIQSTCGRASIGY